MELPTALLRMLEGSCANDDLKNWSVYEEKDGSYTFKIRFIPKSDRHIGNNCVQTMSSSSVKCAFKRKSQKQVDRDCMRNQAYQDRRITRSQTAKQCTNVNGQDAPDRVSVSAPAINPQSPIETVRHASFDLNLEVPEFNREVDLDSTVRTLQSTPECAFESSTDLDDQDLVPEGKRYEVQDDKLSESCYVCRINSRILHHCKQCPGIKLCVNCFYWSKCHRPFTK